MAAFYLIQAADVWSTYEAVKYDCLVEANPLLPEVPHLDRLLLHKILFLSPIYELDKANALTEESMFWPVMLGAWVVHNNIRLTKEAKKTCNLR